jgi:hypothetical protein
MCAFSGRPASEFYFDRFNTPHSHLQEFGNTERLATSVMIKERHLINRAKYDQTFRASRKKVRISSSSSSSPST